MAMQKLSSTINEYFPPETLLEILYKLPANELHKNKIVCKLWSSLISHPSFPSQYSIRRNSSSAKRPTLTLYLSYMSVGEFWLYGFKVETLTNEAESISWLKDNRFSLDFLPDSQGENFVYNKVLASSNGLLLCGKTYCESREEDYYVCNPVTKQWFNLPPLPHDHGRHGLWGIVCCSSSETQFKVVRIDVNSKLPGLKIGVFESGNEGWLEKTFDTRKVIHTVVSINAVEHKGILYWVSDDGDFVRTFDPNLHIYREISLPGRKIYGMTTHTVLGQSQDHLYYALVDFDTPNIPCTIWRYDTSGVDYIWNVHVKFNFECIFSQHNISFTDDGLDFSLLAIDPMDCNVLYIAEDGEENVRIYSLDVGKKVPRELCSNWFESEYAIDRILPFVHPTWPTTVPGSK